MKELKEAARALMREEYERAAEEFGESFHSPHEAYAVIKEEVEEVEDEFKKLTLFLDHYWVQVKGDDLKWANHILGGLEKDALNAACECIQVAAMAYKARR